MARLTNTENGFSFSNLKYDLPASVAVFLVALPLCMGIAIASGVPVAAGLITGILGGIVVGILGGSPLQVSGPAAGLTVVVYGIVQQYGLAALGMILLMAGLLQVLAGVFKLGQWFRAVSPAVIHGMLAGIGVLIFASQFHVMVDDKPKESGIVNLMSIPEAVYKGLTSPDHFWAAVIGVLTICTIIAWQAFAPGRLRVIPAPLIAVVLASAVAFFGNFPVIDVQVPDSLRSAIQYPSLEVFSQHPLVGLLEAAFVMALIASAETLLCAAAVDKMHGGQATRYDRELIAQGIGNSLCGMLGALPMTGVIVRSAANVQAGARTRVSAIMHAVWLLLFVSLLVPVLRYIPVACLAAVLVYTGYKLVNLKVIKELAQFGRGEVAIYVVTLVMIVATDLLTGVLVGVGLSAAKLLYTFSHLRAKLARDDHSNRTTLSLEGAATFLRLPLLAATLEKVPQNSELHVDFERLRYIDHACLDMLMGWAQQHEKHGGKLFIDWDSLHGQFRLPQVSREHKAVA